MNLLLATILLGNGGDGLPEALGRVLARLKERVARCVVSIEVDRSADPEGGGFRGQVSAHRDYYNRPSGPVSGVIYEPDGHILTSRFNVSGTIRPEGLQILLPDGSRRAAKLLGTDEPHDLALLKVEARDLPTLPKADLRNVTAGTFVALVGRSPDPRAPTLTWGVVSATDRWGGTAVQTDAEMNYGNAGGALVTLRGDLIGVGVHIRPHTPWGQSGGVGFACKVSEIDRVLERLKRGEKIEAEKVPFLGILPAGGDPDTPGVQIGHVLPGSPAEKAGLREGDVLVGIDDVEVSDFEDLRGALLSRKIGQEVTLRIRRPRDRGRKEYEELRLRAVLEGRPAE